MNKKWKIGIVGYGNLGKGVHKALRQNADLELAAIFTRRDPASMESACGDAVFATIADAELYRDRIDVMLLCGGSASDLPEQTPMLAAAFSTVDSFDTHARIPEFYERVDAAARAGAISASSRPAGTRGCSR